MKINEMKWTKTSRGERIPVYDQAQLGRIAEAAWRIHFLLPHPDDVTNPNYAANIREFHRALTCSRPLEAEGVRADRSDEPEEADPVRAASKLLR